MIKKYILLLFLALTYLFSQGQDENRKPEKLQALKIAFITQKLNLTADEAQRFWPVFNQYDADLKQLMAQNKGGDEIDNEEKVLNLRKKYRAEFTKVLGQPKMNKLFMAEREFRGALIRRLRNQQQQRMQNRKAF